MPGLISNSLASGVSGYDPATLTVNPQTDTVAGQMSSLLGQDNPYMEAAQGNAMEQANSRGLLNSSIAAGAGTGAAISAALPIAQADAGTNFSTKQLNTQAENTSLSQGSSQMAQQELAGIQGNYNQLLQTNTSASNLFNNVIAQIQQVQSNTNLSADQQQTAVNGLVSLLKSGLGLIGGVSNVNLQGLLDFSAPTA